MSQDLYNRTCEACRKDSEPVSETIRNQYLEQLPGWDIIYKQNAPRLEKRFDFGSYEKTVAFTNKVALLAQQTNHHPFIITAPNYVKVRWWTHIINNLHVNDFIMAARTDVIYEH